MTNSEILYNCIFDELYKNKSQLESVLKKITDKKLIKGFLINLAIAHQEYDVDKQIPIELTRELFTLEEIENTDDMYEANNYFNNIMKSINDNVVESRDIQIRLLKSLYMNESDLGFTSYKLELSKLTKNQLLTFKNYLLSEELYEYIKHVDEQLETL